MKYHIKYPKEGNIAPYTWYDPARVAVLHVLKVGGCSAKAANSILQAAEQAAKDSPDHVDAIIIPLQSRKVLVINEP